MKVFAHRVHIWDDAEHHSQLIIPAGQWREIDDALARRMLADHAGKLCNVTHEIEPDKHVCPTTPIIEGERRAYEHRMMEAPPVVTVPKPRLSQQKRNVLKAAKKRSRIARMNG